MSKNQEKCIFSLVIVFTLWTYQIFTAGFIQGTLVKIPDGYSTIETLKIGDTVFCCDDNGSIVTSTITATQKKSVARVIRLNGSDSTIITTAEQLFYTIPENVWIRASDITLDTTPMSLSHGALPIQSRYIVEENTAIYSMSVKKHNNFFVSEDDILVHNMAAVVIAAPIAAEVFIVVAKAAATVSILSGCLYSFFCGTAYQKIKSHNKNSNNGTGNGRCWCGCYCSSECLCSCSCGCSNKSNKKNAHGYTYKNGKYQDAGYHHKNSTGNGKNGKSPAPKDGQMALDNSIEIQGAHRRVGVSNGQIVILDRTSEGAYHGHVRTWEELCSEKDPKIKQALIRSGLVNKAGKILK